MKSNMQQWPVHWATTNNNQLTEALRPPLMFIEKTVQGHFLVFSLLTPQPERKFCITWSE